MRKIIFVLFSGFVVFSSFASDVSSGNFRMKILGENLIYFFNSGAPSQQEIIPNLFLGDASALLVCHYRSPIKLSEPYSKNPARFSLVMDFSRSILKSGPDTNFYTNFMFYDLEDSPEIFEKLAEELSLAIPQINQALDA